MQQKQFPSVPENINVLSGSPTQNFPASPFGSLSNSSLSGSLSNLQLPNSGSYGNLNHSSSTGNIPQAVNHTANFQNIHSPSPYHRSPCTTPSNYIKMEYNPNSPMSLGDDSLGMEIDNFTTTNAQQAALTWLDLNLEADSPLDYQSISSKEVLSNLNSITDINPNMMHQNSLFGNNNNRTQNSIYGSSPRTQDGYISLYDLEGGEY